MEPNPETERTELLRSLLSLDRVLELDQVLELNRVLELYRVQSAALQRHRRRELLERAARRRQYLRRRRAFVLSSLSAALSLLSGTSRLVWVRDRLPGQNLWAAAEAFDDDEWKAQFRVSRATFDFLLELIGPAIKRRRTNYRAPIAPRRRLAVALWWFARSGEYRTIADMFAVGVATVCMIVRQVSSAIVELLLQRFVSLPSGARLDASLRAFRERGYPQCGGALGSTHIPIAPPRQNPDHYRNSSGWHSVILQAAVDHDGCFTNVYAGWPGSSSSAAVLSSSDLYLKAEDRTDGYLFPPERSLLSEGVEIPVHLIGDASFPLRPWLMKGYGAEQQLSSERRRFTAALGSARRVADEAFARLTGRWRCLLKKSELDVAVTPRVAAACCVLHNVCERRGDDFLPEWSADAAATNRPTQPHGDVFEADAYSAAEVIRDTITYNLLNMLQR